MHRRSGVLYLGQVHARTQLEWRGDLQRRPRTDYARTVRAGAPSHLHRTPDHVSCNVVVLGHVAGIIGMPLVLVSIWIKLRYEEKLMLQKFPGQYTAYQRRVKRLIPFIL